MGMLTYMPIRRTTLILPEALDARLRQEAARRGVAVSDLTREAIAAHLGVAEDGTTAPAGTLSFTGAGASGRADISQRIEELLRAELGPDA